MKKPLIIVGSSIALLLILLLVSWTWLNSVVKKGFVQGVSGYLQAETEFEEFHLDLFAGTVSAENGILHNSNPQAAWGQAQIGQAQASFKMSDIFKAKTPITIDLENVKIQLGQLPDQPLTLNTNAAASAHPEGKNGWPHIAIEKITLHHGTILGDKKHPIQVANLEILAEKTVGSTDWTGAAKSQSVSIYSLKFGLSTAHFTTTDTEVQVDTYQFAAAEGSVTGHATLPRDIEQPAQVHYEFADVPISLLVPASWNVILSGLAQGKGDYEGPISDWVKGGAKGQIQLRSADLKALPFLEKLAVIPGLGGLGHVALDVAKTDYQYTAGSIMLSNLRLEKVNLIALAGDSTIDSEGKINGVLKLGLPTGIVGLLPKMKETIFITDAEGYSWADVNVSGTPDHLQEDLSGRVLGVLGEQGKALLQDGVSKALDIFNSLRGK